MSEPATVPGLVKWDDYPLTEKVAWAMGVEAAGKYADANGGRVNHSAHLIDWYNWKTKRQSVGITDRRGRPPHLYQAFQRGWQAQRAGLLKEYIWDMLGKGLVYCSISDLDVERIFDEFHDRVNLDEWFAGAGE